MPAVTTCPICGFSGNHGFTDAGINLMQFYHGDVCRWWKGRSGATYASLSEAFETEVAPTAIRYPSDRIWLEARRAEIAGEHRKAKRLYAQWNAAGRGAA